MSVRYVVLPAKVEDSLCLVAGGEQVAEPGSAGWPVSCAGTGAESAGMQVGFLQVQYRINNHHIIPCPPPSTVVISLCH